MSTSRLLTAFGVGAGLLLTSCTVPSRVQTHASASFDPCAPRQFTLVEGRDDTSMRWLTQNNHGQDLDILIRKHLGQAGFTEVAGAPLLVDYTVDAQDYEPRPAATDQAAKAGDFRMGTLTLRFRSRSDEGELWTAYIEQVLGAEAADTFPRLDASLAKAFKKLPACSKK
jgi:hypothetical protein